MRRVLATVLTALALFAWAWAAPAQDAPPQDQTAPAQPCPVAADIAPNGVPAAARAAPATPLAVNLTGAWQASAQGSVLEAFVAQKGPFILAVAYVTQPGGKISCYHMSGVMENGRVHVAHKDGYVFDGVALTPDSVCGAVTIKSYPIKIETTAVRRVQGRLRDEQADAFFRDFLPLLPDAVK